MNIRNPFFIRSVLVLMGSIFLVFLLNDLGLFAVSGGSINYLLHIWNNISLKIVVLFVIVYLSFLMGIWGLKSLKYISGSFISLFVILIVVFIFLFSLNSNVEIFGDSLQPSIDYLVVESFDEIFTGQTVEYNKEVKVIVSNDSFVHKVYAKNISQDDSLVVLSAFGLNIEDPVRILLVGKFLVSNIYETLLLNAPEYLDTSLPINQLDEMGFGKVNLGYLESISIDELKSEGVFNDDAYLNLLLSDGSFSLYVNPSKLEDKDVNLLWKSFGFNENVSYESKEKVVSIILSFSVKEYKKEFGTDDVVFFASSLNSSLAEDMKFFLNSNIFSDNLSQRVDSLNDLREHCQSSGLNSSEICPMVLKTNYESLMLSMNNVSSQNVSGITPELGIGQNFNFSSFSTIDKVEDSIYSFTSKAYYYVVFALFIGVLAFVFYWFYFKYFGQKDMLEPFLFFTRGVFFNYLFNFVLLVLIYWLLKTNILLEFISNAMFNGVNNLNNFNVVEFSNFPFYKVILMISFDVVEVGVIFLFLFFILYVVAYFLDKKGLGFFYFKEGVRELDSHEVYFKDYILKYREKYSRESLKKVLIKSDCVDDLKAQEYLNKYYDK